jgi:hypothetical protein
MKIIEGMKKIKELQKKADDYMDKVAKNHAHPNIENPLYGKNQKNKVEGWLQGHSDIIKEILRIRISIQKTNLETDVSIELGGKTVTKTIAEWIHRRRDLANREKEIWLKLNDRGIKEGSMKDSQDQVVKVEIVRYYSPETRDQKIEELRAEPMIIDSTLEVKNAITDLI